MKMKVAGLLAVVALLAGPAFAQMPQPHVKGPGEPEPDKTRSQIESEKADERAYQRSLGNIPNQGPTDPWGNVRSDGAPKPAAKTSPSKRAKVDGAAK